MEDIAVCRRLPKWDKGVVEDVPHAQFVLLGAVHLELSPDPIKRLIRIKRLMNLTAIHADVPARRPRKLRDRM